MKRRAVAIFIMLCCGCSAALAQSGDTARYPTRPVRIVVPFGAGGPSDLLARTVAQKMSESLGQQVIVENRGGANGVVGVEVVARSAPDGYTLVLGTTGTHGINASLVPKLPYDTIRDFAPIARLGISNYVLVAHPSLPVRTVKELLQLAKARPGELTWAAGGGVTQLAAELFKHSAGINVIVVPYKGNAPAVTATMSGEVSLIFGGIAQAAKLVEAGRLRAIAVSGAQRSPALPGVPTVAESGVPGFEAGSWYGLLAPAATPRGIVERLNGEVLRVLKLPDVRSRLLAEAFDIPLDTPESFAAHIRADVPKWAKVIRDAGIRAN
ncbi:MAG TPA: tripartite tricarboxylate transporter substrate binding protein [Burkholderiales bacterium]|nr:tripartite tricarboxylate transporter substrate binding protein [Burkholderiales bacterium]